MAENRFLTPDEVSERYRGSVSVGTLRNWRGMRRGPSFQKIGTQILYPIESLEKWEKTTFIECRPVKRSGQSAEDADNGPEDGTASE